MLITINGKEMSSYSEFLTYGAIVLLAKQEYKNSPTVTFRTKNANGIMVKGDKVRISDGIIFNVSLTNNA